jgi:hypothetical protein
VTHLLTSRRKRLRLCRRAEPKASPLLKVTEKSKALPNVPLGASNFPDVVDVVCHVCKGRHKHKTTNEEIKDRCGVLK